MGQGLVAGFGDLGRLKLGVGGVSFQEDGDKRHFRDWALACKSLEGSNSGGNLALCPGETEPGTGHPLKSENYFPELCDLERITQFLLVSASSSTSYRRKGAVRVLPKLAPALPCCASSLALPLAPAGLGATGTKNTLACSVLYAVTAPGEGAHISCIYFPWGCSVKAGSLGSDAQACPGRWIILEFCVMAIQDKMLG